MNDDNVRKTKSAAILIGFLIPAFRERTQLVSVAYIIRLTSQFKNNQLACRSSRVSKLLRARSAIQSVHYLDHEMKNDKPVRNNLGRNRITRRQTLRFARLRAATANQHKALNTANDSNSLIYVTACRGGSAAYWGIAYQSRRPSNWQLLTKSQSWQIEKRNSKA